MLWSLLKVILFVVIVAALAYGAGILLETDGGVLIAFAGREFTLGPLAAVIALLLLMVLLWVVMKVIGLIVATLRFLNGVQRSSRTLFDHEYQLIEGKPTPDTEESFAYGVTGSFPLVGTVSWTAATTQPIVTPASAVYPTQGAVLVSGANGQTMAVTVITTR